MKVFYRGEGQWIVRKSENLPNGDKVNDVSIFDLSSQDVNQR
jgi:hypothetical protein